MNEKSPHTFVFVHSQMVISIVKAIASAASCCELFGPDWERATTVLRVCRVGRVVFSVSVKFSCTLIITYFVQWGGCRMAGVQTFQAIAPSSTQYHDGMQHAQKCLINKIIATMILTCSTHHITLQKVCAPNKSTPPFHRHH
jgi:hypothetical protein